MSDYLTSVLRTTVPALWGTVVAWLISAQLLPAELAEQAEGFGIVLATVAIAAYYATARWIEQQDWSPAWLSRILLGSGTAPAYTGRGPGTAPPSA